jgi:hypothetical protein
MRSNEFISKPKMSVQDLLETPDFIDKEMPSVSNITINFYSDATISRMFDVVGTQKIGELNYWVLLKKDKSFAVVGYIGNRREDNAVGLYQTGTVEFKSQLDISYTTHFKGRNALQVDSVQVSPLFQAGGQGYLLYLMLVRAGYVIISDNMQYIGGRKLWNKISQLGKQDGMIVRIINNDTIMSDENGDPIDYDGSNISDDQIWAPPTNDVTKSKHYVVLVAKNS